MFELANTPQFAMMRVMNATVLPSTDSTKVFRFFLAVSIAIHLGVLLYKKKTILFAPPSSQQINSALTVRLQQRPVIKEQPKEVIKKITPKKIKKQGRRKALKPQKEVVKKEVQKKLLPNAPKKMAFNNAIRNYVEPHYPRLAIRRGITGTVKLSLMILGNGQVKNVLITQSSGHDLLDSSVMDAAKQWVFNKLSDNPQAIYKISKTLVFKLN